MPSTLEDYLALPYRMEITPGDQGGYVVNYPDLPGCITQVDDLDDAVPMGREILTGWLEIALEDGAEVPLPRPPHSYSGKFVLRLPTSLHRQLAQLAEDEGVSLNQYAVSILAQGEACSRIESRIGDTASLSPAIYDWLQANVAGLPPTFRQATTEPLRGLQEHAVRTERTMMLKGRITEPGLVIPREVIDRLGSEVIGIIEEPGRLVITPVTDAVSDPSAKEPAVVDDSTSSLGNNPVNTGVEDGSTNHDRYLYSSG